MTSTCLTCYFFWKQTYLRNCTAEAGQFVAEGTMVNMSSSDTYIKYINQTTIALWNCLFL